LALLHISNGAIITTIYVYARSHAYATCNGEAALSSETHCVKYEYDVCICNDILVLAYGNLSVGERPKYVMLRGLSSE